ncbi:MAG: SPOR domain-containing protein [Treponema sp.]|nr:SPOR domain-containing protein [Treponema sp.]
MVLIRGRIPKFQALALFFILAGGSLYSQNGTVLLTAETVSIEKKLSDPKLAPPERQKALANLARLLELSGNMEAAAAAWKDASQIVPGNAGHGDLLQSARCLAAIGEFDGAEAALRPILASEDPRLTVGARLLAAQMEAHKTGSTAALENLLNNTNFAAHKPALYYTIWKISTNAAARTGMASRLQAEFPASPEARIVRGDSTVNALPAAFWIFGSQGLQITGPAVTSSAGPSASPANSPGSPGIGPMLQTGLFSREANASAMADKLRHAGFSPVIRKKAVNGQDHWVVTVPPGPDLARTIQLLKEKGFESFPVN